jgi:protein SCO1/2
MADALGKLGSRRKNIVPIFITIDPARDTSSALREYLKPFGADFVGLTGSADAIRKVAASYHVFFTKRPLASGGYAMDHTSVVYLMGPDGKFVTYYGDETIGPDKLAADLRKHL